ncbi:MAG: TIM barrel protein, partial [Actinomycetota bacterium]|nr:TIM barrel protein [Actinomycetota bacterium]
PTEVAYDFWTTRRTLDAVGDRPGFGLNFDPSHFNWQFLDPVAFLLEYSQKIYHVHCKESERNLDGRNGILASHLPFGDLRRGWDFVSVGHGSVPFERIVRALNAIGYQGPLSIEWEDAGMDREYGAPEALEYVRNLSFEPSAQAFDAAFASGEE